jgi:hypothetical protein
LSRNAFHESNPDAPRRTRGRRLTDLPVDRERRKRERRSVPGWSALFEDMRSAGLHAVDGEHDSGPPAAR